jgi:hypothetical protein
MPRLSETRPGEGNLHGHWSGSPRISRRPCSGVAAVRVVTSAGDEGEVTFTFGDHLGSSSTIWQASDLGDTDPGVTSYQRYYPYGEPRDGYNSALPTDHTFTGQVSEGLSVLSGGVPPRVAYRRRYGARNAAGRLSRALAAPGAAALWGHRASHQRRPRGRGRRRSRRVI